MNTATEESSGVRTQAVGERLHGKDKEFVVTEITSTGRVRITTATREAIAAAEAHPGYGIPREVHPGRQAPTARLPAASPTPATPTAFISASWSKRPTFRCIVCTTT